MTSEADETIMGDEAQVALEKGDLHKAADLCKSLLASFPQSARSYSLTSSLFRATGNYRKAYDYSSIAAGLDHCVSHYHAQQGEMLYLLREYAEAMQAYERAAAISQDAKICRGLGYCLIALERFDEAKAWFAKAGSEVAPVQKIIDDAQCDMQSGDTDNAEKLLYEAIAAVKNHPEAHFLLALLAIRAGEFDRAEALLRKTLMFDAGHALSHFYLAVLLAESGDSRGAADRLLQSLSIDPTHVPSLIMLGGVFMQSGDVAASEKAYTHALALTPDHLLAWYNMLELLHEAGRGREALQRLGELLQVMPSPPLRHLRALFSGDVPPQASREFIAAFYGVFAEMLEPWVIAGSDAPHVQQFADELRRLPELADKRHLSVLDLGCGTGIFIHRLSDISAIGVGVDVSPHMIRIARRRKCYDVLYELDLLDYIAGSETLFDVVASVGALRWMGNLQPFFHAVRGVMHRHSILAFMLDKENSTLAYSVANHGRYTHHFSYVTDVAAAEGLQLVAHKEWAWERAGDQRIVRHQFFFKKMTVH